MIRTRWFIPVFGLGLIVGTAHAGPFAPAAGLLGSTAIRSDSTQFVSWATSVIDLTRGPILASNPGGALASFGNAGNALGSSDNRVVSLGDGGWITLTFANAIYDGPGFDFAVFENSFSDTFLELGFVEVSSNGSDFFRFEATSLTQTSTQVGPFGSLDPTDLNNLAGKYRGGFGTPFDLAELAGTSPGLDLGKVRYVRIRDVVGSIDPLLGTRDGGGRLINDPYPTAFASGGFDLDAIGVIHAVPEPTALFLMGLGSLGISWILVGRRSLSSVEV